MQKYFYLRKDLLLPVSKRGLIDKQDKLCVNDQHSLHI